MKQTDYDVFIIGAGPVGLTAGIQLRTHGIDNIRVVDKRERPTPESYKDFSRAIGVHARTVEYLEDLGLADKLQERGTLALTGSYFYNEKMMYRMDYHTGCDNAHLRYDWNLMVTQANTQDVLRQGLTSLGQAVDWETEVIGFESHDDYVAVTIRDLMTGKEEKITTRYLLGCGGAHSLVRKELGIDFPGKVYPVRWVVCDLHLDWDIPHDDIAFLGTKDAFAVTLPLKGWGDNRYRVTMMQPIEAGDPAMQVGHAIPTDGRRFTRADCEAFFQKIYPKAKISCPDDAGSWFMVHCRLAEKFRVGNCFLVGDAAHIHSPILGQGMNTGIQDATNLAWKIAAVLNGKSDKSLLDTYESERKAIAESVIKFTDHTTRLIIVRSQLVQILRGYVLNTLLRIKKTRRLLISKLMQLLLTYNEVPTVLTSQETWQIDPKVKRQKGKIEVRAGDRVPDPVYSGTDKRLYGAIKGNGWTVTLFEGQKSDAQTTSQIKNIVTEINEQFEHVAQCAIITKQPDLYSDLDAIILTDSEAILHDVFDADRPCVYVLRPDRHIGYRGHTLTDVGNYLSNIFLKKSQAFTNGVSVSDKGELVAALEN